MAEQSVPQGLKKCGFFKNFTWRTVFAIPTIRKYGMKPPSILRVFGISRPKATVMTDARGSLSYAEFAEGYCRFATGLAAKGGAPGDGVMVMLPNGAPFLTATFGCTTGGYTSVVTPPRSTSDELTYLAENSEAKWIVLDARYADRVAAADLPNIPSERRIVANGDAPEGWLSYDDVLSSGKNEIPVLPEDTIVHNIAYTSGTTGKPKGAKRNVAKMGIADILNFLEVVPFRNTDVHLVACPLYHAAPIGVVQTHLILGARLVIMERFDPEEWLRLVSEQKITTTILVPTMIHDLVSLPEEVFKRYDLSSMRIIMTTGAPLTPTQRAKVRERMGDVLYDMYGSTEWGWLSVATPQDHLDRPGTVGKPLPGTRVKIVNDERTPVAQGEVGELFATTALLIDEYHQNPEATNDAMLEGYLSVGDLVREDEDGYLYIADRKNDMVISGGVNLYPPEIEAALKLHPAVADVAVIGVPDERMGEKLLAWIVIPEGQSVTADEIIEFAREKLSGPKIPREYRFVDAIPYNPMGKVLRQELRGQYAADTSG